MTHSSSLKDNGDLVTGYSEVLQMAGIFVNGGGALSHGDHGNFGDFVTGLKLVRYLHCA